MILPFVHHSCLIPGRFSCAQNSYEDIADCLVLKIHTKILQIVLDKMQESTKDDIHRLILRNCTSHLQIGEMWRSSMIV